MRGAFLLVTLFLFVLPLAAEETSAQTGTKAKNEVEPSAGELKQQPPAVPMDKKVPEVRRPFLRQGAGILGAGMLIAIGGTGLAVAAIDKFDQYETLTSPAVVDKEREKPSFSVDAYQRKTDKIYKDAEILENTGIAMFAVGGAAMVTGIVLMCLTEEAPVTAMVTPQGVYIGWKGEF